MRKKEPKVTHLHKYQKSILGGRKIIIKDGKKYLEQGSGYEVLKCVHPGCPHYVGVEVSVGRECACWVCGDRLFLDAENLRLRRPTHSHCRKVRTPGITDEQIIATLRKLGIE